MVNWGMAVDWGYQPQRGHRCDGPSFTQAITGSSPAQAGGRAPRITRLLVQPRSEAQAIAMNKKSFMGDKPVNRIGFGAMQLAGPGVFGPPRDPGAARAVLRRAIELGVDHIDTAQYYGPDVVNELIREVLHPYPENLKLVTKVGARRDAAGGASGGGRGEPSLVGCRTPCSRQPALGRRQGRQLRPAGGATGCARRAA